MSDILNSLREAATNPEKAKEALAGLTAKWSDMTEEQREQATVLLGSLKDKVGTLPDDAKAQVSDVLSRFTK